MAGDILTPADRAHFLAMMRRQTNSAVHRRMNTLLLLDDGWTAERVAEALFIDAETVREHRRRYALEGRTGIERLAYEGHAPTLTEAQMAELATELSARLYLTAKAVCGFVAARFGVTYTPHAMAKLLVRMGFVWKRPKCVPAKADAEAQRAFLAQTLAPLMAIAEANPAQPLYFVDATHPAYDAHPACGWIRRGETRMLKSNHGRVNVTLAGALSWPGREVVTREAKKMTGPEMVAFFAELAVRHPTATAITLVLDNATYNRAKVVRDWLATEDGQRIKLVYLPPYAPNLNLIERFWWFFKKHALWNVYYPTFADFKAGIIDFFSDSSRWKNDLLSLITDRFHFIDAQQTQISSA
ncbi:transposase (plasmid) [Rhodovastum atsumiense]|uniref:IS630 family transposase n=1 Tax=Rhodovastum atsumiense TaxID=504468 RepID=A0A5M6IJ48_9PROT|nr:IS630 family transposase [Rhodovastum atsumiense]KAA5608273.1 IS630 family transposase [Rhodovastum atsumiense]CAH2605693.1 transposase [Rhodovastum atsumiense]